MLTEKEIQEQKDLESKVTPGPWIYRGGNNPEVHANVRLRIEDHERKFSLFYVAGPSLVCLFAETWVQFSTEQWDAQQKLNVEFLTVARNNYKNLLETAEEAVKLKQENEELQLKAHKFDLLMEIILSALQKDCHPKDSRQVEVLLDKVSENKKLKEQLQIAQTAMSELAQPYGYNHICGLGTYTDHTVHRIEISKRQKVAQKALNAIKEMEKTHAMFNLNPK